MRNGAGRIDNRTHACPYLFYNFLECPLSVFGVFWELRVVAAQDTAPDVSDDSAQCLRHEWTGVGGLQVEYLLCV